jgi:predicted unusual protein kinase regulating ubiquinone biosynthesis (AarF/ABC1/UbiB family)
LNQSEEYQEVLSKVNTRSAGRILQACLNNGGFYIKFGHGLVMGETEIEQMFIEDFGKENCELFREFTEELIAAASLAQVMEDILE